MKGILKKGGGIGKSAALSLQLLAAATFGGAAFCIVNMSRHGAVSCWELHPDWMILHFHCLRSVPVKETV